MQRPNALPNDTYQYYPWMSVKASEGIFHESLEVMNTDGLKVGGKVLNPNLAQGFNHLFATFNPPKAFNLPNPGDQVALTLTGSTTSSQFTNYTADDYIDGAPALDGEGVVYGQLGKAYMVEAVVNIVSVAGAPPANPRLRLTFEVDQPSPPNYEADGDVWVDEGPSGDDHSLHGLFLVKSWPAPGTNVGRLVISNFSGSSGDFSMRSCLIKVRLVTGAEPGP